MRVFTATFLNKNYGSHLQAYALQCALKELGAEPVVIQQASPKNNKQVSLLTRMRYRFKQILRPKKGYSRFRTFILLMQDGRFSRKYEKIREFREKYISVLQLRDQRELNNHIAPNDILLAGSDQIWSMASGPLNDWFCFRWDSIPEYAKKYSYAASIGQSELTQRQKLMYYEYLKDFRVVSFREGQAAKLLSSGITAEVRTDLDPTLLFDGEFWSGIAASRELKEPYVFIYMLRPDKRLIRMGRMVGEKLRCRVVYTGLMANRFAGVETVCDAGVEDFLSYIQNADAVITNSFHGTVFSILFRKQFISVKLSGTSSRVENLLELTGLTDRYIENEDELMQALLKPIDYSDAMEKLRIEREKSLQYLHRICTEREEVDSYPRLTKNCRGCGACAVVCPTGAITMQLRGGFRYPVVSEDICVKCGLCETVCNKAVSPNWVGEAPEVYYGWNRDPDARWQSTSGGAFLAVVDAFFSAHPDGWVYGAVFNKDNRVIHIGTNRRDEILAMCRSKYLQSELGNVFPEIIERLKRHEYVLFSGTPCQVAGLKALATDLSEYLLTVDFICHGVSNPDYFARYLSALGRRKHHPIDAYSFRNKQRSTIGSSYRLVKYVYEDGKAELTDRDLFVISYKLRLFYRDSCYSCPFASTERCADITMGDFWGIENKLPQLKSERLGGISMVMLNTEKAVVLKEAISEFFILNPMTEDFSGYRYLFQSTSRPKNFYIACDPEEDFLAYLESVISMKQQCNYAHPNLQKAKTALLRRIKSL